MVNIQDRLKKIKYRCQTLGIKELDVTFSKIYERIEKSNNTPIIDLMEDLLDNETQYIFDLFFNEVSKEEKQKYSPIIDLSK
ncbi:succinate dehydrogenase assembly factor 2 [Alphaproteobacteria bacterium]|jgi:succinate dehydrogenase flavin-adding protein (antitoxin of CptAB toxin-antitoxin module)|nr:succinate dehydrogenase assembly factor 2 [Alphaproteobacteria bacterium]